MNISAISTGNTSYIATAAKTSANKTSPFTFSEILATTRATAPVKKDACATSQAISTYATYKNTVGAVSEVSTKTYSGNIELMSEDEIWDEYARLEIEGRTIDYTGMTDVEIYQSIYDRYSEVFGESFISTPGFIGKVDMSGRGVRVHASASFMSELKQAFGSYDNVCLVNRKRMGCIGMTYAEAEQAVMQKYSGKELTVRDVSNIVQDLGNMGYMNGSAGAFHRLIYASVEYTDWSKLNEFYDNPFNMADAKQKLDDVFSYSDATMKQMVTNLYAMFSSMVKHGHYNADEDLLGSLSEHLSKYTATDNADFVNYLEG